MEFKRNLKGILKEWKHLTRKSWQTLVDITDKPSKPTVNLEFVVGVFFFFIHL